MKSEFAIVIPVYNEEKLLKKIIYKCKNLGDLIIVNDGSTDRSSKIINKFKIKTILHKKNLGYDASILSGFLFAKKKSYKYLIFIDADGELPIKTIKSIKRLLSNGKDIVSGVRNKKNRSLEILFSAVSYIFWGIRDPMCGMKGFNLKKISKIKDKFTSKTFATEILFKLLKIQNSIAQIPIKVKKRRDKSKVGNSYKVQILILKSIVKSIQIKLF